MSCPPRRPTKSRARASPASTFTRSVESSSRQRVRRLPEELDRALVDDRRAPAGLLEPDRGGGQQLGVVQIAGEVGRGAVGGDRALRSTSAGAGRAELQLCLGDAPRVRHADRERRREAGLGLVVGQRRDGIAAGEQRVLHRALGPVDRRGGGEVVGEIGDPRPVAGVALERLAHAQVQLGAPQPRHAVVERPAHELVGELEGELPRRAPPRSSRARSPAPAPGRRGRRSTDRTRARRPPRARGRRSSPCPGGRGAGPTTSRTPSGLRRSASVPSGQPPSQRASESTSVRHSSVMRNALPPVSSRSERATSPCSARGSRSPARSTNSAISSALRPASRTRTTPSVRRRSASADDSVSGISASVSRNVVRTSPCASGAPRARCRRSSSVGGSAQCASSTITTSGVRLLTAVSRSEIALCSRWRSVSGSAAAGDREPADALGQVRAAGARARRRPRRGRRAARRGPRRARAGRAPRRTGGTGAGPPRRRLRRGRRHRAASASWANSRTRRLLPEPGLAADEREPQPVAVRRRDEVPERRQLPRASRERERGGQAERTWELVHHRRVVRSDHPRHAQVLGTDCPSGSGPVMPRRRGGRSVAP